MKLIQGVRTIELGPNDSALVFREGEDEIYAPDMTLKQLAPEQAVKCAITASCMGKHNDDIWQMLVERYQGWQARNRAAKGLVN
jgi:DICT domain-containing protein